MHFTINHILAPVDLGDSSRPALRAARLLAERFGAGITALYVDESLTLQTYDSMFSGSGSGTLVRDTGASGLPPFDPELANIGENPARAIVRSARRSSADLIVMGTHSRRGVRRLLDCSVAEKVLRSSPCPVLVVPEVSATAGFSRILCVIDQPESSREAARVASEMAEQFGAELVFARVDGARIPWAGGANRYAGRREVDVENGAEAIFGAVRDVQADLLVVASQQLRPNWNQISAGLSAEDLIRWSPCAVLDVVCEPVAAAARVVTHAFAIARV